VEYRMPQPCCCARCKAESNDDCQSELVNPNWELWEETTPSHDRGGIRSAGCSTRKEIYPNRLGKTCAQGTGYSAMGSSGLIADCVGDGGIFHGAFFGSLRIARSNSGIGFQPVEVTMTGWKPIPRHQSNIHGLPKNYLFGIGGFSSHFSPKKSASAILPGQRESGGVVISTTAQSGSFGTWRALLR